MFVCARDRVRAKLVVCCYCASFKVSAHISCSFPLCVFSFHSLLIYKVPYLFLFCTLSAFINMLKFVFAKFHNHDIAYMAYAVCFLFIRL